METFMEATLGVSFRVYNEFWVAVRTLDKLYF